MSTLASPGDGSRTGSLRSDQGGTEARLRELAPVCVLALVMVVCFALIMYAGRATLPFFDEWDFILGRRGHSLDTLLRPHNGHLIVAPLIVYKALLQVGGLDAYWLFRAALAALHLLTGLGVFVFARRRVGEWGAVLAASVVLVCFSAADDMIWAFQISFLMSVASGVWMLVALDREDLGGDIVACVLLIVSLASAAIGASFLLAALVLVLGDSRRWRRVWVPLVPLVLFGLWSVVYSDGSEVKPSNLTDAPRFAAEMASNAAGALVGLGVDFGRPLFLAFAALALAGLAGFGNVRRYIALAAACAAAASFWGLTALARADLGEPLAPRYIYPGAVLIVLVLLELFRGRSLAGRGVPVAAIAIVVIGISNFGVMDAFGDGLRSNAEVLRARLGALELVKKDVPPDFQPIPVEGPQIRAGEVEVAQRDFGRIALPVASLSSATARQKEAADQLLASAGAVTALPAPGRLTNCRVRQPGPDGRIRVKVPAGGSVDVVLRKPASTSVSRFGATAGAQGPSLVVSGRKAEPVTVTARRDGENVPWVVAVDTGRKTKVCAG